ncbi:MAG: tRNA (N(6)-L-threonylcarbamoyladenosine(37)-C(2))-methylthiotransferase MtaB [Bacteroidetes bacterium]|nr:tRNA (N(6)-L-threonylcarbamoyladenosine(37)-C(2))-methylthiotransferase MtaB [Bacteroidota bacterium]
MHTVAFYTLGCKLNFSETSAISRQFAQSGYTVVDFEQAADVYVINTCSVTDHADRKCKKVVREAKRLNPKSKVVIIGCYAQLKPEEILGIEGVDGVFGAAEKFDLPAKLQELTGGKVLYNSPIKHVTSFHAAYSLGERTRTFLKVQDGCNYFCAFCTIPLARGRSRSDTIPSVLSQARQIAQQGIREIVLTGVNLGDFGYPNNETFIDLIRALDDVEGIDRFRISSIEPNLLTPEVIDFVSTSGRFAPHFHIPLQSGSDKILQSMRRRYERKLYRDRVERIIKAMPHACIGVDAIVGFPGETQAEFNDTYTFIRDLDIAYLHAFSYSERPNTTALRLDGRVPNGERTARREMLQILSEKKKRAFYLGHLNTTRKVLFESKVEAGFLYGHTDNYIYVKVPYDPALVHDLVPVRLQSLDDQGNVTGAEASFAHAN